MMMIFHPVSVPFEYVSEMAKMPISTNIDQVVEPDKQGIAAAEQDESATCTDRTKS
jgi:hypothetical protein